MRAAVSAPVVVEAKPDLVNGLADLPLATAWQRWGARNVDLCWEWMLVHLLGVAVTELVAPVLPFTDDLPSRGLVLALSWLPLVLLLDAAVAAKFGNTPGKALLGLRVLRIDGTAPGFWRLVWRNLRMWLAGLGLGLPMFTILTSARQHRRLKEGKQASYDGNAFRVVAQPVSAIRTAAFWVGFLALFGYVIFSTVLPPLATMAERDAAITRQAVEVGSSPAAAPSIAE